MENEYKKLGEKKIKIKDDISGYDKDILIKTYRLPNGIIENFFIEDGNDSIEIFAITPKEEIILVKQFRVGNEKENIELPGGGVESDENILEAGLRELKEETGYEGEVEYLGKRPYGPYSNGYRHFCLATNCKKIDSLDLDKNEFLKVILCPNNTFREWLKESKIRGTDSAYIAMDYLGML